MSEQQKGKCICIYTYLHMTEVLAIEPEDQRLQVQLFAQVQLHPALVQHVQAVASIEHAVVGDVVVGRKADVANVRVPVHGIQKILQAGKRMTKRPIVLGNQCIRRRAALQAELHCQRKAQVLLTAQNCESGARELRQQRLVVHIIQVSQLGCDSALLRAVLAADLASVHHDHHLGLGQALDEREARHHAGDDGSRGHAHERGRDDNNSQVHWWHWEVRQIKFSPRLVPANATKKPRLPDSQI